MWRRGWNPAFSTLMADRRHTQRAEFKPANLGVLLFCMDSLTQRKYQRVQSESPPTHILCLHLIIRESHEASLISPSSPASLGAKPYLLRSSSKVGLLSSFAFSVPVGSPALVEWDEMNSNLNIGHQLLCLGFQ